MSVDLPAPLGPSSAMRAPARSTSSMLLNRDFSPYAKPIFSARNNKSGLRSGASISNSKWPSVMCTAAMR